MRELFEDRQAGAFYSTAEGDSSLVMRIKEDYDGAEPSGNSVATLNLLRLRTCSETKSIGQSAEKTLHAFASKMAAQPTAMPQMLVALMHTSRRRNRLFWQAMNIGAFVDHLRRRFLPNHTRSASGRCTRCANMPAVDGRAAAYVCENFTCKLPTVQSG